MKKCLGGGENPCSEWQGTVVLLPQRNRIRKRAHLRYRQPEKQRGKSEQRSATLLAKCGRRSASATGKLVETERNPLEGGRRSNDDDSKRFGR